MSSLFAVYLGGRAPKCNTELHDVVFVVGDSLRDTKTQLVEKWFGSAERFHVDSYIQLDTVDGHTLKLSPEKSQNDLKLYFVNLGAYKPGHFTEFHENRLYVAKDKMECKARAKKELCEGMEQVHTDDLFEVDDVIDDLIELEEVEGLYLHLQPKAGAETPAPTNGWLAFNKI